MEIRNAKIENTKLGYMDGVGSLMGGHLVLDYGGAGQYFGGYCFGGVYTDYFIKGILETLKVETWEQLKGTFCRAEMTDTKVLRIGHILEDRWFNPEMPVITKQARGKADQLLDEADSLIQDMQWVQTIHSGSESCASCGGMRHLHKNAECDASMFIQKFSDYMKNA